MTKASTAAADATTTDVGNQAEPTSVGGLRLRFSLRSPFAKAPEYATSGAGCFDLFAPRSGHIRPRESDEVDIGVAFEVPEGYTMLIFGRSGHGIKRGVRLANCTGVIDQDFRGTVKVKLTSDNAFEEFTFQTGDRIAQAMLVATPVVFLEQAEELSETERGDGGLGSTGA